MALSKKDYDRGATMVRAILATAFRYHQNSCFFHKTTDEARTFGIATSLCDCDAEPALISAFDVRRAFASFFESGDNARFDSQRFMLACTPVMKDGAWVPRRIPRERRAA